MALIPLNNTTNNVTINVTAADNTMAINLSPDSTNTSHGTVLVYESFQNGMGVGLGASLDLTGYLSGFKSLNPGLSSIQLTFTYSNYNGPGSYAYFITGAGITLFPQAGSLNQFTSQMDSYLVNIF